jgi:hypothetical protein
MACFESFAKKVKVVCTLEDHVLRNGFGAGVIEQLSDAGIHTPVVRIGWPDQFVEHGTPASSAKTRPQRRKHRREGARCLGQSVMVRPERMRLACRIQRAPLNAVPRPDLSQDIQVPCVILERLLARREQQHAGRMRSTQSHRSSTQPGAG